MGFGFCRKRIFPNGFLPLCIFKDLGTDPELFRTIVGISCIFQFQWLTDDRHVRVGKYREQPLFHDAVKGTFFIK